MNPVQIRWKSHVSFPLSEGRWPSLIRRICSSHATSFPRQQHATFAFLPNVPHWWLGHLLRFPRTGKGGDWWSWPKGIKAKGTQCFPLWIKLTSTSMGYPLSVFNKNSTLEPKRQSRTFSQHLLTMTDHDMWDVSIKRQKDLPTRDYFSTKTKDVRKPLSQSWIIAATTTIQVISKKLFSFLVIFWERYVFIHVYMIPWICCSTHTWFAASFCDMLQHTVRELQLDYEDDCGHTYVAKET